MWKRTGRIGRDAVSSILAAAALLALAALPGFPRGGGRRGTDIEATRGDGTVVKGELVAVRPKTLVIRETRSGEYLFMDLSDIALVRIPKTSKARGMWSGLIQGTFIGAIAGDVLSRKGASTAEHWLWWIGGGLAGGGLGALFGGSVAVPTGEFDTIRLGGRPKAEVDAVLAKLQTLARISDFR